MSAPEFRDLRDADLPEAAEVFIASQRDMFTRHALFVPDYHPEHLVEGFRHGLRTGIFRGAFLDGRLVSICLAVVREGVWFLASFWTMPEAQGKGIGGPLLQQTWNAGDLQGARTHFVWASPDFPALALYMSHGMLPGCQIFNFVGAPPLAPDLPGIEVLPLNIDDAARVDQALRGVRREQDHAMWLAKANRTAWLFRRNGTPIGYGYVEAGERVGPVAWLDREDAWPILGFVLANAGGSEVRLSALGVNHDAIRIAQRSGLRIFGTSHLLTDRRLDGLDQYVPSGPALF